MDAAAILIPAVIGASVAAFSRKQDQRALETRRAIRSGRTDVLAPSVRKNGRERQVALRESRFVTWGLLIYLFLMAAMGTAVLIHSSPPAGALAAAVLVAVLWNEGFRRRWVVLAWTRGEPEVGYVWEVRGVLAALRGSESARKAVARGEPHAVAGELLSDSFVGSPLGAEDVVESPDGRLWAVARRPLHIPLTPDPPYAAAAE